MLALPVVHQSAAKAMLEETLLLQPAIKVTSKPEVVVVGLARLAETPRKQTVLVKVATAATRSSG
jgi:hypothetical protein